MKKITMLALLSLFVLKPAFPQVADRLSFLNENSVKAYAKPLATTLGVAVNAGTYHSASISKFFGFSVSAEGMWIIVPKDQQTFVPDLPAGYQTGPTATIFGNKGGAYAGPNGYIIYPPGINETNIPVIFPQVSASTMGTELMVRYLPSLDLGETSLTFFGAGLSHSISQYIPLCPVDIAIQGLYTRFNVKDIFGVNNFAFNVHVSKSFMVVTPYIGLQYEKTSMNINYTIKGDPNSGDPMLQQDRNIDVSVDGANSFRTTVGATIKLASVGVNLDYSFSSQSVLTAGVIFEY
jgi:Family of unknown function (DUF6588)